MVPVLYSKGLSEDSMVDVAEGCWKDCLVRVYKRVQHGYSRLHAFKRMCTNTA